MNTSYFSRGAATFALAALFFARSKKAQPPIAKPTPILSTPQPQIRIPITATMTQNALALLWTGTTPVPNSLEQYLARTVIHDPAELDECQAAHSRWIVILDQSQKIASLLMPRDNPVNLGWYVNQLQTTLNPEFVLGLKQEIRNRAEQQQIRAELSDTWQAFSNHYSVPYQKLLSEYPHLRQNMGTLLSTMIGRAKAELARITPFEGQRMKEAAVAEAAACGMGAKDARPAQKSHILTKVEEYISDMEKLLLDVRGQTTDRLFLDAMGQARWLTNSFETVNRIANRLSTMVDTETPAGV